MAGFKTHIRVATIASIFFAAVAYIIAPINRLQALLLILLGAIGGILPDIDSDNSTALKWVFDLLAPLLASFVMFGLLAKIGIIAAVASWLLVFFLTKTFLMNVFRHYTVHRGVIHSLPMVLFMLLLCLHIASLLGVSDGFNSLMALFLAGGYSIHLLLDEIYSVDLRGLKIKRSFGSALTLFKFSQWPQYLMLYLMIALLTLFLPPALLRHDQWFTTANLSVVKRHLWPQPMAAKSTVLNVKQFFHA